jgi:Phosphoribosyl transferase (PRTase)
MSFSGSYRAQDVTFLLKPIPMPLMPELAQKERLIQTGTRHYSEMLSPETLPSAPYLAVFRDACRTNLTQMAHDCLKLAGIIKSRRHSNSNNNGNNNGPITLVSLMRAGTPIGVILKHLLTSVYGCETSHYSISIIRDRGIDQTALRWQRRHLT